MKYLLTAYFLTWAAIPFILLAQKRPVSTLAWVWTVILFPFIGPIAYLLFGLDRLTRRRQCHHDAITSRCQARGRKVGPKVDIPPRDAPLFQTLECLAEIPVSSADEVRLLPDTTTFFPALHEWIEKAKHHVHVQFFVFEEDEPGCALRDRLIAAARRGVIVRLLLDPLGCAHTSRSFFRQLEEAGGSIAWFRSLNPLRSRFCLHLRNHRKLQIIDGRVAFVGGMNVGPNYTGDNPKIGRWRDLQMELHGPIVSALQEVFAEDWEFAAEEEITGDGYYLAGDQAGTYPAQVVIGGPDLAVEAMADSFAAVLHHAGKRAWVSAGYFVPNDLLLSALRLAANRGVDVRLVSTEKSDHPYLAEIGRSYYEQLLRAGVRIFEYRPGMHHAKAMLIDDELVMVGSANCDNRSMRLNFELNVLVRCASAARALEEFFVEDFGDSREVTLNEHLSRPFHRRLLEAIVRPLAPTV
ncbi:MAG: cardiolipin synthase [Chthoniobacter sp.]|uniref:cardiolipin synthase n=1 Tax=Chthoniobacter sp. TaxID=2510640 RepID=UPI0032A921EC